MTDGDMWPHPASQDRAFVASQSSLSTQSRPEASIPRASCRNCASDGWVCENHLDMPWYGGTPECCPGAAGSPCPVCQPEMAHAPLIFAIAQEARRYAAFYQPGSDGRNTFEMFAEFVETRSIASAIEARRAETGNTGSVHESAGPKDDAQTPSE